MIGGLFQGGFRSKTDWLTRCEIGDHTESKPHESIFLGGGGLKISTAAKCQFCLVTIKMYKDVYMYKKIYEYVCLIFCKRRNDIFLFTKLLLDNKKDTKVAFELLSNWILGHFP